MAKQETLLNTGGLLGSPLMGASGFCIHLECRFLTPGGCGTPHGFCREIFFLVLDTHVHLIPNLRLIWVADRSILLDEMMYHCTRWCDSIFV